MSKLGSKYDKYRSSEIYPHKHCLICKKMIPEEDNEYGEYCSEECAGIPKTKKKKNRKRIIYMVIGYFVVFGAIIGFSQIFN